LGPTAAVGALGGHQPVPRGAHVLPGLVEVPGEDQRVGRTLQQAFKKAGIAAHVKTAVETAEGGVDGVTLRPAGGAEIPAERVLVPGRPRPTMNSVRCGIGPLPNIVRSSLPETASIASPANFSIVPS